MIKVNQKSILEAALFASTKPLTIDQLRQLFDKHDLPSIAEIKDLLSVLKEEYLGRGVELQEVSSGYRFQVKTDFSSWLQRLCWKKPVRYSHALLETLALIAYCQPISRGEIEEIRGVSVSSAIMKKLLDREWIKVVGYRDMPGKPSVFGTTKYFLDYFNLKDLTDLPPLKEIVDFEKIELELRKKLALVVGKETVPTDETNSQKRRPHSKNIGTDQI
ncbi:MAG: SMC-Scp complex subunit ScpB [Coxiella-like endosymbiont]